MWFKRGLQPVEHQGYERRWGFGCTHWHRIPLLLHPLHSAWWNGAQCDHQQESDSGLRGHKQWHMCHSWEVRPADRLSLPVPSRCLPVQYWRQFVAQHGGMICEECCFLPHCRNWRWCCQYGRSVRVLCLTVESAKWQGYPSWGASLGESFG